MNTYTHLVDDDTDLVGAAVVELPEDLRDRAMALCRDGVLYVYQGIVCARGLPLPDDARG